MTTKTKLSPPGARHGVFPLLAQVLPGWLMAQINPHAPAYHWHLPGGLRIEGPLDINIFEHAWGAMIQRHETLRSTFRASLLGQPLQHIHRSTPLRLERADLMDYPSEARESVLRDGIREQLLLPFDWEHTPPWRITLYRLDRDRYFCFLAIHHMIFDAWSQRALLQDLTAFYGAYASGAPAPLVPAPGQYADYIAGQMTALEGGNLENALAYWERVITPPPPFLDALFDHPLYPDYPHAGCFEPFSVPHPLHKDLIRASQALKTTLFALLLANFALLLYRRTREERLIISVPVANRTRATYKNAIGCFGRLLPIEAQLDESLSFRQLVQETGLTVREGLKHQDVPMLRVFERLHLKDPKYWSAMNQVTFAYQNALQSRVEAAGVSFALDVHWDLLGIARGPLICQIHESAEGLHGYWEYTTCLFDKETVVCWIEEYLRLMQAATVQPDASIQTILSAAALEAGESSTKTQGDWILREENP